MGSLKKFQKYGWLELFPFLARIFKARLERLKSGLKKDYGISDEGIFGSRVDRSLTEIIELAEQKKQTMDTLKDLLKDLRLLEFPSEIRELVKNNKIFFSSSLATRLLQESIGGKFSEIRYNELSDENSIFIIPETIIKPLQALRKKVIMVSYGFTGSRAETKRQLVMIQNLIKNFGWKGFYRDVGHEEGACVSKFWAKKDSWTVLTLDINHWDISDDFDWTIIIKESF